MLMRPPVRFFYDVRGCLALTIKWFDFGALPASDGLWLLCRSMGGGRGDVGGLILKARNASSRTCLYG